MLSAANIRVQSAFSLVELLVVITILAILSTVAYTSFSGSTDKAKNSKRLEHMGTIETALESFKERNSYYPVPGAYSAVVPFNYWGYKSGTDSSLVNTATLVNPSGTIDSVTGGAGGGTVKDNVWVQLWAKWVMEQSLVGKELLTQDIADPSADTKVGTSNVLKDYGIGRYVYAVYAKQPVALATWNSDNKSATAFNIAVTVQDDQKGYVTKIGGNFDDKFGTCANTCPVSLIGPGGAAPSVNLKDGDIGAEVGGVMTKIPYKIKY